jgi:hypothetical protein
MSKKKNVSIFKVFPLKVVRKVICKIPLNNRWGLASATKEIYKIISHGDRYKHRISITDKIVSLKLIKGLNSKGQSVQKKC